MIGATGAVRSFTDALSCPCLCLDSMASNSLSVMTNVDMVVHKDVARRRKVLKLKSLDLRSSFLDKWSVRRLAIGANGYSRKKKKVKHLKIVDNLGGQYEDGFDDVKNVSTTNILIFFFSFDIPIFN